MALSRRAKAALVLGGCAFAFAAALGTGCLRYRMTDNADRSAAAGMYGFGDFILVLFVGFVLSLLARALLLHAMAGR